MSEEPRRPARAVTLRDVFLTHGPRWRSDPAAFFTEVLGIAPWSHPVHDSQETFLRAVRDFRFVACRSGHKTGKSCSIAGLGLWWPVTQGEGARVILTAPSFGQIENILWPELRLLWQAAAKRGIRLGPEPALNPGTGFEIADKQGCYGISTNSPERMAGLSGAKLLFMVDEASGYPEEIFASVFGNLSGGGKVVLSGNPTRTSGTFFDAFNSKRETWRTLHVRTKDTPNFRGGRVPGLADPSFLDFARGQWGEGTPDWQARIDGDFPTSASNAVIGIGLIERAIEHDRTAEAGDGPIEIGVDVARFGDDSSAIAPRCGHKLWPLTIKRKQDNVEVAHAVVQAGREVRAELGRPAGEKIRVKIDVSGGYGGGVADLLRAQHAVEFEVVDVNSSNKSDQEDLYPTLRDQLWFGAAQWLREGGNLPPDDKKLHGELAAPTYQLDARGRRKVEPKDEIKKRIGRSPDRADALALACYSPQKLDARAKYDPRKGLPQHQGFDDRGVG